MSKPVKSMITETLRSRYADVNSVCVVDMTGLSVQQQEGIRGKLREKSAKVHVVKNGLARRAFDGTTLEPLGKALTGPCALVTSEESLIDVAKALVEAAKEFEPLKLKQAIFDGDPDLFTVEELSRMKGLRELLGEIGMLVSSPGRGAA